MGIINAENKKKFQGNTAISLLKNINVVNFLSDIEKIYFRKFVSKIKIFDYSNKHTPTGTNMYLEPDDVPML